MSHPDKSQRLLDIARYMEGLENFSDAEFLRGLAAPSTVEDNFDPNNLADCQERIRELEELRDKLTETLRRSCDDYRAENHGQCPSSAIEPQELARWNLVRRWFTRQETLYIPGIHQAETIEAVNEAVDRAIAKYASTDGRTNNGT